MVAAGTGREDTGRPQDEESGKSDDHIVKTYFGDPLLFACYEFYDRFKHKPNDWKEMFEFLRYIKVKGVYREMAFNAAKRSQET
jgi:hypothetical protein